MLLSIFYFLLVLPISYLAAKEGELVCDTPIKSSPQSNGARNLPANKTEANRSNGSTLDTSTWAYLPENSYAAAAPFNHV